MRFHRKKKTSARTNQNHAHVGFSLLVTLSATGWRWKTPGQKEIARLICRQRETRVCSCTMKERQTRGWFNEYERDRETHREKERERERERIFRRLSYNFVWVGRSTATMLSTLSNPPPTPPFVCVLLVSLKRNNYYRKSAAHACGKPRGPPTELH